MISNIFKRPTAQQKMMEELEQARVELLTAQTNAEYWDAMVAYNTSRVERLSKQWGVNPLGDGE